MKNRVDVWVWPIHKGRELPRYGRPFRRSDERSGGDSHGRVEQYITRNDYTKRCSGTGKSKSCVDFRFPYRVYPFSNTIPPFVVFTFAAASVGHVHYTKRTRVFYTEREREWNLFPRWLAISAMFLTVTRTQTSRVSRMVLVFCLVEGTAFFWCIGILKL